MKHRDHTHETVAEARACEASLNAPAAPAADPRIEINARLLRQHTNSAIMANLTGMEYRPQTPQAAKRADAKFERMNRTAGKATQGINRAVAASTRDAAAFATRPAHPNRVTFAAKLIGERDTEYLSLEAGDVMMNVMDDKAVSADEIALLIDQLLKAPRQGAAQAPAQAAERPAAGTYAEQVKAAKAQVPDGRYAANVEGGKVRFFLIKEAKGFVKISEYASDDLYPRQWGEYAKILGAVIEAGVEEAGRRFGDEMGQCRKCGRALTDEENPYKVYGFGPDCGPRAMGPIA